MRLFSLTLNERHSWSGRCETASKNGLTLLKRWASSPYKYPGDNHASKSKMNIMDLKEIRARVLSCCVTVQPWCAQAPCYTVYAATNKRATRLDNKTDGCGFVWITFAAGGWRCHSSRYSCVCVCVCVCVSVSTSVAYLTNYLSRLGHGSSYHHSSQRACYLQIDVMGV
jgi:hypothetical protein